MVEAARPVGLETAAGSTPPLVLSETAAPGTKPQPANEIDWPDSTTLWLTSSEPKRPPHVFDGGYGSLLEPSLNSGASSSAKAAVAGRAATASPQLASSATPSVRSFIEALPNG